MAMKPNAGPITSENVSESGGPKGGGADPMAEALQHARDHPPVVPPGIHVPSNMYGPKAVAARDAEERAKDPEKWDKEHNPAPTPEKPLETKEGGRS